MNESDDLDSQLKLMLNKARRSLAVAKQYIENYLIENSFLQKKD